MTHSNTTKITIISLALYILPLSMKLLDKMCFSNLQIIFSPYYFFFTKVFKDTSHCIEPSTISINIFKDIGMLVI